MLNNWICRKQSDFDPEAVAAFDNFLGEATASESDMPYDLALPKHLFLSYVTDCTDLLIHGSPTVNIDILRPIRHSRDVATTGQENRLLAASDGLRAMWFAILDKSNMGGLTSNYSTTASDELGALYSLYLFSIGQSAIHDSPYQKGMMYILPRGPFELISGIEWATDESVEPLFHLSIEPQDFPYLQFVKGVDPEKIIRKGESGADGYPWADDPEIYPVAPEIPIDFQAASYGNLEIQAFPP